MNFTATDILLSTAAFFLLGIFLAPPGYALGWLLDLASFRQQPAHWRILLSLPLSIALTPILVYLLGRFSLASPIWLLYGALLVVAAFIFQGRNLPIPRAAWIAIAVCFAIVVIALIDLQFGHRLYYSVAAYDYSFRAAITGAFVRAQHLPASNPFFFAGTPQPFRYHYFWFMIAALPIRLSEALFGHTLLAPRYAVIASSVWVALGLMSIAALYVRFVLQLDKRVALFAIALFGVSGLDIVPMLPQQLASFWNPDLPFYATIDWWNADQVTGWLDTVLWVPHSAASLIACLMGFLVLWNQPRFRWQAALGAALAFASSTGISVYVTAVFAVVCVLWTLYLLLRRDWPQVAMLVCAGVCAAILAAPFLQELTGNSSTQAAFARFTIRNFDPLLQVLEYLNIQNAWVEGIGNLILLPLNYFLELGVFLIAGVVWFRARRKGWRTLKPSEVVLALLAIVPLVVCSFVRSATINMNDLGARGMLVAQFALLLMAANWLAGSGLRSRIGIATLAIGILTSVYEFTLLRTFEIASDYNLVGRTDEIAGDPNAGLRGYSARIVYKELDRTLPPSAVVQHNPDGNHDILAGLYTNRQFAIRDLPTAITFTGNATGPEAAFAPVAALFNGERNDPKTVCRDNFIDVLVVKDNDKAWENRTGWVWNSPVLFRADRAIAISCR